MLSNSIKTCQTMNKWKSKYPSLGYSPQLNHKLLPCAYPKPLMEAMSLLQTKIYSNPIEFFHLLEYNGFDFYERLNNVLCTYPQNMEDELRKMVENGLFERIIYDKNDAALKPLCKILKIDDLCIIWCKCGLDWILSIDHELKLKVLRLMVPFLDKSWRLSNLDLISRIYLELKPSKTLREPVSVSSINNILMLRNKS